MDTITQDNRNWFQKLLDNIRNSSQVSQTNFSNQVSNTPPDVSTMPLGGEDPLKDLKSQYSSLPLNTINSSPVNFTIPSGTSSGNNTAPQDQNGDTLQGLYQTQLSAARDEARRQAGYGYDRARGIYDEGMGLLGTRRNEFKDIYDTGRENILGGYEKGRGQLQASNQGAETRMANALRALGLGGSAFVKSEGANRQNAAKALGNLNSERNTNELANTGQYNENQNWANTQENALRRSLEDAGNLRSSVESSSDIGYLGDMGNLFNTILSNQLATKAAAGQYTANPYSVNISDMTNSLNGNTPSLGTTGNTAEQGVNINQDNSIQALLKRLGGNMYAANTA